METVSGGQPRAAQLPFLPGMTFADPTRTNYHKSHAFDIRAGRRDLDQAKPGIGGQPLSAEQTSAFAAQKVATSADLLLQKSTTNPQGYIPSWAGQVLRFEAYYKEPVEYTPVGFRVRRCAIAFHLEDDSLEIMSLDHASGRPQGTLVRRHRVPRDGNDKQHITAAELNVGQDIVIYSRNYHIYNCDLFTNTFLAKLGIAVPDSEDLPDDVAATPRGTAPPVKPTLVPTRPAAVPRGTPPLAQFLANDRNVLRYYCVWDDRASPFGDLHKFKLHYFLADNTLELVEEIRETTSLDVPTTFVKRGMPPEGFPELCEIKVGSTISLYSRNFLVYDMDPKTKNHYREHYGITDITPLCVDELPSAPPKREIPPHTGFGSEEDSYASCMSLVPKPAKIDWHKRMENNGRTLQFEARFDNASPADRDRCFAIIFGLADDTVAIFEQAQRDIQGGRFFEKARAKHPDGGRYYGPSDFYVGARVTINGYKFFLISASEWAFRYMESHVDLWPECNFDAVSMKIARHRTALLSAVSAALDEQAKATKPTPRGATPPKPGYVEPTVLRKILEDGQVSLTPQEFCTLQRRFDLDENNTVHLPSLTGQLKAECSPPVSPKPQTPGSVKSRTPRTPKK